MFLILALVFGFIRSATLTKAIRTGTSINGPITPANAWSEFRPNTAMETAMANSKLLPVAVNAMEAFYRRDAHSLPDKEAGKNINTK